jgi:hypothetical protein
MDIKRRTSRAKLHADTNRDGVRTYLDLIRPKPSLNGGSPGGTKGLSTPAKVGHFHPLEVGHFHPLLTPLRSLDFSERPPQFKSHVRY